MLDIVQVANKIQSDINNLRYLCNDLESYAQRMAQGIADYDKALKIKMLELRSAGMAVSMIEKTAKGDCHKECLEKELGIALFKIQNTKIEACKSSLMGYQSINRHLSDV